MCHINKIEDLRRKTNLFDSNFLCPECIVLLVLNTVSNLRKEIQENPSNTHFISVFEYHSKSFILHILLTPDAHNIHMMILLLEVIIDYISQCIYIYIYKIIFYIGYVTFSFIHFTFINLNYFLFFILYLFFKIYFFINLITLYFNTN